MIGLTLNIVRCGDTKICYVMYGEHMKKSKAVIFRSKLEQEKYTKFFVKNIPICRAINSFSHQLSN